MGGSSSTPESLSERGEYDDASAELLLRHLGETGRLYVLTKPDGSQAHVLGVVPGSEHSSQEAAHLIRAVRPQTVYVDVSTWDEKQIRASMEREARVPWRPSEQPPTWGFDWDAGALSFVMNMEHARREIWRMVGVDTTSAWRAALRSADAVGAKVVTFPVDVGEVYEDPNLAHARAGGVEPNAAGNNSTWSDAMGFAMQVGPLNRYLVEKVVQLPVSGHLTTREVDELKRDIRASLEASTRALTVEDADVESNLTREAERLAEIANKGGEDAGDADTKLQHLAVQHDLLLPQSRVAAWQMRDAPGDVVGIVDIARAAPILRAWDTATPPEEALRPRSWQGFGIQFGLPIAGLSGVSYGYYKLIRRFRRTGIAFGVLSATGLGFGVLSYRSQPAALFGISTWAALARPVPLIGESLGLGPAKGRRS